MYMHAVCMHIYLVTSERLPEGMAVSKEILSVACNCSGSESLENLELPEKTETSENTLYELPPVQQGKSIKT